jgi:hypothetical protein
MKIPILIQKYTEGPWDAVMHLIGQAHTLVHQNGIMRVQTDIRIGTRYSSIIRVYLTTLTFNVERIRSSTSLKRLLKLRVFLPLMTQRWRRKSPQCRPIKGQASTGNGQKSNNPRTERGNGGVCSERHQSGVLADTFMPLTGKVSWTLKMNLFQIVAWLQMT